ncbi:MAG: nucleotide exchange factor GrpE [Betaproteobacteria bacterium RIFCSPLOWO2_12_FULL_65_14]|nr:MAG: nucleotide exchange factor GrpE [Betaproteobacteria bacterium RIFCSPLOWO2_12_FULL_65_14]
MQEETVQPQNSPQAESAPAANRSLEELLAEAQAKVEQQREQMLRALADTENVRKRLQSEAANAQKYALERFAGELLPVVDSLEAGLKTADVSGLEVILRQLKGALDKANIREINPAPGERFDPHRQQAMAAVEAESEPNTVVAVMQKGYTLHDRVLRPALVTVAKPAVEKTPGNPISDTQLD